MIKAFRAAFQTRASSLKPSSLRFFNQTHPGLEHAARPPTRFSPKWQTIYQTSQRRAYSQRRFRHQGFQQTQSLLHRWAARPTFYREVGGLGLACAGFYIYNLETVPISGRRRFNIVSPALEARVSAHTYEDIMRQFGSSILPPHSREHRMVQRVLDRLIPQAGLPDMNWEAHVIEDDSQKNAFVIPGGKVFVFTGILDLCQDDDRLAAVLGHEIAHNVAHHAAEGMSRAGFLLPLAIIGWLATGVDVGFMRLFGQVAIELPGSRVQESEADRIGLLIMAQSCYDPAAALGLWAAMEEAEKAQGVSVPQLLSTHPSNHDRLEKLRSWLPEANLKRELNGCAAIGSHVVGFERFGRDFSQRQRYATPRAPF